VLGSPNSDDGILYSIARERCYRAIFEYQRNPGYKVLLTGGYGAHFNTTEKPHACYLKKFLEEQGIPEEAFAGFVESTNTLEDATMTKSVVTRHNPEEIIIITSDYHAERARYIFAREYAHTGIRLTLSVSSTNRQQCDFDLDLLAQHERDAIAKIKSRDKS